MKMNDLTRDLIWMHAADRLRAHLPLPHGMVFAWGGDSPVCAVTIKGVEKGTTLTFRLRFHESGTVDSIWEDRTMETWLADADQPDDAVVERSPHSVIDDLMSQAASFFIDVLVDGAPIL